MTLRAHHVPVPVAGQGTPPLIEQYAEVTRRHTRAVYGDDDLADAAQTVAANYAEQQVRCKALVLALDGEAVVGGAFFGMPLRDNRTLAEGDFAVDSSADTGAVLRVLWDGIRPLLVEQGRSTAQVWTAHPANGPGEQLVPRTGVGRLPQDPLAAGLQDLGFVLEQQERHSVLDVTAAGPPATRAAELARATAGPAYEVLGWTGPTPQEHREPMAQIRARMSTDIPSGELEIEPEVWDADRVAEVGRIAERLGFREVTTAVRHVQTGQIVAYTVLESPSDKPHVAYQGDTLVHAAHRGHRLGLLAKAANLQLLAEALPAVGRIHTWNAGENEHMLAINHALGFVDGTIEAGWQLSGLRG